MFAYPSILKAWGESSTPALSDVLKDALYWDLAFKQKIIIFTKAISGE